MRAAEKVEPQCEAIWVLSRDAVGLAFCETKKLAATGAPLHWWILVPFAKANLVAQLSDALLLSVWTDSNVMVFSLYQ